MNIARVISLLVGLFGLFLVVVSLISEANEGAVPGLGQKVGGTFLLIVGLIITLAAFAIFFRMRRR